MVVWFSLLVVSFNIKILFAEFSSSEAVNCTIYKDNLANAVSSFTSCAILYSRPITFCENCVDVYINVLDSYQNLSNIKDESGPCIESYVNLDRLEIVRTLYDNSFDLWNRAKCYECFQIVNGRLTNNVSVETTTFNELFKNLTSCINRTDVNETTLCPICIDTYNKLNDYYISISNENEKIGVCMDIVDVMNGTRAYWSQKCCKFRRKDEHIFIICTLIVSFVTVLFYILTKLCSQKKTPIILKQTRFAGSFNQVFN